MDLFNSAYLHSQIFWTALSFAIMMAVLAWKGLPAITKILDERAERIRTDLATAEQQRLAAEKALADYEAKLAKAKDEAAGIVNTARTEAKALIDARMAELEQEIARRREEAKASINATKAQAMKELQGQVADLAVQVTEQLLAESVDAKKAKTLTDKAVKELVN
jgi:F-type H+-transporting ATPase subunit b